MQPPSTDPKYGRNTDHGETETHRSALKKYASISLQLCGLSVLTWLVRHACRAVQIHHVFFSVLLHACIHVSLDLPTMLTCLVSVCALHVCHMRSIEPNFRMNLHLNLEQRSHLCATWIPPPNLSAEQFIFFLYRNVRKRVKGIQLALKPWQSPLLCGKGFSGT